MRAAVARQITRVGNVQFETLDQATRGLSLAKELP
jgi:hypothetical protein